MTPTDKGKTVIYQMMVVLERSTPPIWRRIQVTGSLTLAELHDVIQIVMGWTDSYLHRFTINRQIFGRPDDEFFDGNEPPMQDERAVRLADVVPTVPTSFSYQYDDVDDWWHTITVEKTVPPQPGTYYPTCLSGNRACPPEDIGGIVGYEILLEVLADPRHPEYKAMQMRVGEDYDPELFDQPAVNQLLYMPQMRYGVKNYD